MKSTAPLRVSVALVLAACSSPAPPAAGTPLRDSASPPRPLALSRAVRSAGWFTTEQAARGKAFFTSSCASCHGTALQGGAGPALAGANFFGNWGGKPLSALYAFEHSSMPLTSPGSLSQQEYADITAYLLEQNGFAPGSAPLTAGSDLARLVTPSGHTRDLQRSANQLPPLPPTARPRVVPVRQPSSTAPAQDEIRAADSSAHTWLTSNKGYLGHRFSPLADITPANAGGLRPVCQFMTGEQGTFEGAPLVYDGTLFFTTTNGTWAIDAATCQERWNATYVPPGPTYNNTNRGLALAGGRVFRGTIDGHVLAYDARTGALLWDRDVTQGARGKFIAAAPLVWGELLLIGNAGGDLATVGGLHALRIEDGSPVWTFNTIPSAGEAGAESWTLPGTRAYGGGAIWTSMSLDPSSGIVYVPVGNPAPDFNKAVRPGDNLYSVSVVAVEANTGKLRWYFQGIAGDDRDWDMSTVALVEGPRGTPYVAASGKHGLLYLLDRSTGKKVWEAPVTTRLNTDKPIDVFGVRYCPGTVGGVEWNGPAWSPPDSLLLVNSVDWCVTSILGPAPVPAPGLPYTGLRNGYGTFDPVDQARGWIHAIDVASGAVRWKKQMPVPMIAGLAPTRGGVVFTGDAAGMFYAIETATGRELYRFHTGGGMGGGVITYRQGGRQLVAALAGNSSRTFNATGSPTVVVFGL
jgi:PQQ-dependent dehydrogenase (methanol/ethanol family)